MKKPNNIAIFILALVVFVFILVMIMVLPSIINKEETYIDEGYTEQYYIPESIVYDNTLSEPISNGMPDGVSYRIVQEYTVLDTKNASRKTQTYPQFEGVGDSANTQRLNSLICDILTEKQRIYGQGMFKILGSGAKIIYDISDFKITYIDESFLSMVFTGRFVCYQENDNIDTGDSLFSFSVNINLMDMTEIADGELLVSFLELKNLFISGKMELEYGQDAVMNDISYIEMFSQFSSMYRIYPSLFFTSEKMLMIIPLTNDLGGYAVFSCSINESKAFLNVYNSATLGLFS